jgi:transposase
MPPIEAVLEENEALKGKVVSLEETVAELQAQLAIFKKQIFGSGRNEKQDKAQLLLKLGQLEAKIAEVKMERISYERRKPGAPRQSPAELFEGLPVKETIEIIPDEVKADPDLYERIGEETTFEVDIVQPQLFKRLIVRPKYRHLLDRSRPPLVAPAMKRPVMGGYASAGLISTIILSKYAHHLPLYRQEQMSARWGAKLSRKTMADWVAVAADWFNPIYLLIKEDLISGPYIQADETPIRCQDPDEPGGKTLQGWLWAISRPGGDVVFEWRLSRRHEEAHSLLAGFTGVLQADGYPAYTSFAEDNKGVIRVGCFAHARRGFHEARDTAPVAAGFMLGLIGHFYRMEQEWDERQVSPGQRTLLRQRDFELTLRLLRKAALLLAQRERPKSPLGQACRYLLNQWDTLVAHCDHGCTRLDNNLMENVTPISELHFLCRDGDNADKPPRAPRIMGGRAGGTQNGSRDDQIARKKAKRRDGSSFGRDLGGAGSVRRRRHSAFILRSAST